MSRNVNWDDPSEADLRWAVEWERWHDLQQAGLDPDEVRKMFELQPHSTGGKFFNTAGVPGDDFPKRFNPETGRVETVLPTNGQGDGESVVNSEIDEDDDLPPYSEWKVEDLKEELTARGLATTGKKEELVRRLEIYDESQAVQD